MRRDPNRCRSCNHKRPRHVHGCELTPPAPATPPDPRQLQLLTVVGDGCPHAIGTGDVCAACRRLLDGAGR